jgi:hypothetical protein
MRDWSETIMLHERAVAAYREAATSVRSWDTAPKPGKWTAGQITAHLNLSFAAMLCEMQGGPSMALRTKRIQRLVLRFTIQRRLMKGGEFPVGAPAPRETRPPESIADRATLMREFDRLAIELHREVKQLHESGSRAKFRHPYFGAVSMVDGLYISARHIDHHRAQIEAM